MSETEKNRLIAWNQELIAAHQRLREALRLARDGIDAGGAASVRADLTLRCRRFCAALSGHHASEDQALFPHLAARHPELRPAIAKLSQDHEMIASLIAQLDDALTSAPRTAELSRHLDGLAAIMESHFSYEERQLLEVLSALDLAANPDTLLGPL